MARSFAGQSLVRSGWTAVTTLPFTLAAWARATNVASVQTIMSLANGAGLGNFTLGFAATGHLRAFVQDNAGAAGVATTTATATNNVWCHACGVFANSADRGVYLNGANQAANVTPITSPVPTVLGIAYRPISTPDSTLTGLVMEAAVWSVALNGDEVMALARGCSPFMVRPAALVGYWPIFGIGNPEPDYWKNALALTLNGASTKADHNRMMYPEGLLCR